MPQPDLNNPETIINIFANNAEMVGISMGVGLFVSAILVLFLKKWALAGKLALTGIAMLVIGLGIPGALNWLIALIRDANVIQHPLPWLGPVIHSIGIIGIIIVTCFALVVGFLPTIIAFKKNKQNRKLILVLNILMGWIPLGWGIVLFMTFIDDKIK